LCEATKTKLDKYLLWFIQKNSMNHWYPS
jgi:hypothetical protein